MVIFLVTPDHAYTHKQVVTHAVDIQVNIVSYQTAFSSQALPWATYVFTDLDRLSFVELQAAAALYRCLKSSGMNVLNDPARVPSRYGLLRLLHEAGINHFNVYRVEERVKPERWPVFVRAEGGHDFPLSGLLHNWNETRALIDRALNAGSPLASMLIVEYAGEPLRQGVYRKLATFQVGNRSFAHNCVHDDNWIVKYGKLGVATADLYEDELRIAKGNPYGQVISRAFQLASIDYGRADFGIVDGAVQVYEINSNPNVTFSTEHPFPVRLETYRIIKENYLSSLYSVDTRETGSPAPLNSPILRPYQERGKRARARMQSSSQSAKGAG